MGVSASSLKDKDRLFLYKINNRGDGRKCKPACIGLNGFSGNSGTLMCTGVGAHFYGQCVLCTFIPH